MALSDLGFSLGLRLQDRVHASFGMSVSPPPCSPGFILVATVSRASIRINEDLVALILQLGGQATNFQVTLLANWCFHFEVSSKVVSFLIYGSRKFEGACFLFISPYGVMGVQMGNTNLIYGWINTTENRPS
jgi:hypothetical protein